MHKLICDDKFIAYGTPEQLTKCVLEKIQSDKLNELADFDYFIQFANPYYIIVQKRAINDLTSRLRTVNCYEIRESFSFPWGI